MPRISTDGPKPPPIFDPGELDWEPGSLPVEPDEGIVPSNIPEDPERARVVDPEDREPGRAIGGGVGPALRAQAPRYRADG
jgi:hypothetical protein